MLVLNVSATHVLLPNLRPRFKVEVPWPSSSLLVLGAFWPPCHLTRVKSLLSLFLRSRIRTFLPVSTSRLRFSRDRKQVASAFLLQLSPAVLFSPIPRWMPLGAFSIFLTRHPLRDLSIQ